MKFRTILLPVLLGVAAFTSAAWTEEPLSPGANPRCVVKTNEKVDPDVFSDHQGRRIYFCCEECQAKFLKDPAPYLANLPPAPDAAKAAPVPAAVPAPVAAPSQLLPVSAPSAPPAPSAAPVPASSAPWMWRLFGRLHPMTVHFPIALLFVALLIESLRLIRGKPLAGDAALTCIVLGAIGAAVAAAMGWANAGFRDDAGRAAEILAIHRRLGLTIAGLSLATALLALLVRGLPGRARLTRAYVLALLAVVGTTAAGGHYGGMIVFGEDYISSAIPDWMAFRPKPAAALAAAPSSGAPEGKVDFVHDIQPIFKASCVSCHGPEKQKGDLRLDAKHLAIRGGKSRKSILPGDGEHSTVWRRINHLDNEKIMPQNADPLPEAKIALLRKWIDEGAAWPDAASIANAEIHRHWAYVKPDRPALPAVKRKEWVRNPIDAFLLARLEKEGLPPSPEAPREILIRRVSLDLTGLPPTPEETDAFVADASPDAYEKLVDRLLASPHYGERWARLWLDLARYADTNGYEKDNRRTHWKYRDWVIDAFNRDLPFDRFTIEQIAGDMLPNPTEAQKIATGFHRNTMTNEEGGVDGDEAHWEVLVDRVGTTGTVWLGSTVACSQCHDHKFDPFLQRDFYRFLAFFNNVELGTRPSGTVFIHHEATLEMPTPEQEAERKRLREELAGQEKVLGAPTPELEAAQAEWEMGVASATAEWKVLDPESLASDAGTVLTKQPDGSVLASGERPARDVYTVVGRTDVAGITAVRLEVLTDDSLPQRGPGRSDEGEFILTGFEVGILPDRAAPVAAGSGEIPPAPSPVVFAEATADQWRGGHEPANLLSGKPDHPGWTIDPQRVDRQAVFLAKAPFGDASGTRLTVRLKQEVKHLAHLTLGKFRLSVTSAKDPKAIVPFPAPIRAIVAVPPEKRTDAQRREIAAHYRSIAPALDPTRERISKIRGAIGRIPVVSAMIMQELPSTERPSAVVRIRGGFTNPGEKVWADVPSFLPPLPEEAMPNRLGLAKWLVSPENPLTARVTVNRIWETVFGTGIVETTEDFGTQGQAPSHPGLLDWLATEFQGNLKWSWKGMVRLLVTSSAYRQSSTSTPLLREKDPFNRLLARGPRFRMEAEMIRDVVLSAAGQLSPKIGGPSVFPPQPDGIWDIPYSDDKWTTAEGEDRYRRGIYTFLRRTVPYPMFLNFDATSREACTVRRIRTNTPLQALNLLNDEAFFDAARALARRMMTHPAAEPAAKAACGFRLCVGRKPTEAETARLAALYAKERERYEKDAKAAGDVVKGSLPPPKDLDPGDLAAWTLVANVLLNLDETLTKE